MFVRPRLVPLIRRYSQTAGPSKPTTPSPPADIKASVPGLSSRCVKPATEPVGPGASPTGAYKVPEYFCFDRFSYHEAEVEMAKYRCPQPNANRKQ